MREGRERTGDTPHRLPKRSSAAVGEGHGAESERGKPIDVFVKPRLGNADWEG